MITLDNVLQGPGGLTEDTEGGFEYCGWVAPFMAGDDNKMAAEQMKAADLLLGRKTFEIWENYWPSHVDMWPGINEVTKYVLSSSRTSSDWQNCEFLNGVEAVKQLKNSSGGDLKVWGSSELVQLLLKHNLVDELCLRIYPIVLGKGKKLFNDEAMPAAFKLTDSFITSTGVILANYKREGEVKTGNIGE
jgi:dihydrofolate reductase